MVGERADVVRLGLGRVAAALGELAEQALREVRPRARDGGVRRRRVAQAQAELEAAVAIAKMEAERGEAVALLSASITIVERERRSMLESCCLLDSNLEPIRDTLDDPSEDVTEMEALIKSARALLAKMEADNAK